MSSSIGSTFSSGVQDVSAILPLMGTEQCESHVASGLEHGFLYPAATTLSIFGSLGAAKAGLMVFIASSRFSLRTKWLSLELNGAEILKNAGFGAGEDGLSAVLFNKEGTSYGVEKQLEDLKLQYEDLEKHIVNALPETYTWNSWMIFSSACLSILGIAPYIHLNIRGHSDHSLFLKWFFPSSRVLGSFLVAVCGQLVMQHRILSIVRRKFIVEAKLKPSCRHIEGFPESLLSEVRTDKFLQELLNYLKKLKLDQAKSKEWSLLSYSALQRELSDAEGRPVSITLAGRSRSLPSIFNNILWPVILFYLPWMLVLVGSSLIVVGYVGCFSIVQGTKTDSAPIIWLGLEISLSIIRMFLWASNPSSDEKTGISFRLETIKNPVLPTCSDYAEMLDKDEILPLTSEKDFFDIHLAPFLGSVNSSEKTIPPFRYHRQQEYFYTLTRLGLTSDKLLHRLYITVYSEGDCDESGNPLGFIFHKADTTSDRPLTVYRVGKLSKDKGEISAAKEIMNDDNRYLRDGLFLQQLEQHYVSILTALQSRENELKNINRERILSWTMCESFIDATKTKVTEVNFHDELMADLALLSRLQHQSSREKDVEMGSDKSDVDELSEPTGPHVSTDGTADVTAIQAYLSFGKSHRDRLQNIVQLSDWVHQHLNFIETGNQMDDSVRDGRDCGADPGSDGTSLTDWLESLEAGLVEECIKIESELHREYTDKLEKLLAHTTARNFNASLRKRLSDNGWSWVSRRLAKLKDTKLEILRERIRNLGALPIAVHDCKEPNTISKDQKASREAAFAADIAYTTGEQNEKPRLLNDLHNTKFENSRLVQCLGRSNKWVREIIPENLFFATLTTLKQYVINDYTLQMPPDLVMLRNPRLECVFFDIKWEDHPPTDDTVQSCLRAIQSNRTMKSLGFGQSDLTAAWIDVFGSYFEQNPNIHVIWFSEKAEVPGAEDTELLRKMRSTEWMKDKVLITYQGAPIQFALDLERVAFGGRKSSLRIEFQAPPKRFLANNQVVLYLDLRRSEEYLNPTVTTEIKGNLQGKRNLNNLNNLPANKWKTVSFRIDSFTPGERNTIDLTIAGAYVAADVKLETITLEQDLNRLFGGVKTEVDNITKFGRRAFSTAMRTNSSAA